MALKDTNFRVLDNTGVKNVKCIYVYDDKIIQPGSVILVTIKYVLPHRKLKKGQLYKAVVVRLCKFVRRLDMLFNVKYYTNGVVLLKKTEMVPIGTRINGSVFFEVRLKGFLRIGVLSSFLL
jgi:large subunit ribosomal protein L14